MALIQISGLSYTSSIFSIITGTVNLETTSVGGNINVNGTFTYRNNYGSGVSLTLIVTKDGVSGSQTKTFSASGSSISYSFTMSCRDQSGAPTVTLVHSEGSPTYISKTGTAKNIYISSVTAPTSVTTSNSSPKFNQNYTISWSGGHGTGNNPLLNYTCGVGTGLSYAGDTTSTSITKGGWQRSTIGNTYSYYVRTNGIYNKQTSSAHANVTITGYNVYFKDGSTTVSTTSNVGYVPSTLPSYSKAGYRFDGWYTAASGGSAAVAGAEISSDVTYYAHLTTLATYTVSYNANGGTGAPASQTKTHDITLTLTTSKPTRTGYTFAGWNTNSSGTGTNYSSGGSYTANAAVTLYAKWTINTYTLTFKSSNTSYGTVNQSSWSVNYGSSISVSSNKITIGSSVCTASTMSATGYTRSFTGWSWSNGSQPSTMPASNITVTANFTSALTPTLTFSGTLGGSYTHNGSTYYNKITPVLSSNVACTVKIDLQIGSSYYACYGGAAQSVGTSSTTLAAINVNSILVANGLYNGNAISYSLRASVVNSSTIKTATGSSVSAKSTSVSPYFINRHNTSNMNPTDKFFQNVRFYYTSDTELKTATLTYSGSSAISASTVTSTYADFVLPTSIAEGSSPAFTINLYNAENMNKGGFTYTPSAKKVGMITIGTLSSSLSTLHPFQGSSDCVISVPISDAQSTTLDAMQTRYGLGTGAWATLTLSYNNKTYTVSSPTLTFDTGIDGFKMTKAQLSMYPIATNAFGLPLYGTYTIQYTVSITNLFGYKVTKTGNISLTLNEPITIVSNTPQYNFSGSSTYNNLSGMYIREQMFISDLYSINCFTTESITCTLQYKLSSASSWSNYSSSNVHAYTGSQSTTAGGYTNQRTPSKRFGEVSSNGTYQWRLAVTGSRTGTGYSPVLSVSAAKFIAPTITLSQATVSNNNITSVHIKRNTDFIGTPGVETQTVSYTYTLATGSSSSPLNPQQISTTSTAETTINNLTYIPSNEWNSCSLLLKLVVSTTYQGITTTKEAWSSPLLVYNATSTIAYRKNRIGINLNSFEHSNDSVIEILASTGHSKIYLSNGSKTISINLDNGEIDGATLLGKTW